MPEPAQSRVETAAPIEHWRNRIDGVLERTLEAHSAADPDLRQAMRHAVLLGGKRMRPLLVYATGNTFGANDEQLDAPAAAVELIHAYSLVHDDLPAMDDDALRRGRPTVHVAFGDATAILAGDALQALAFMTLATAQSDPEIRVRMLAELAYAAGAQGMCGGQALDLAATGEGKKGPGKRGHSEVSRSRSQAAPDDWCDIHSDRVSLSALERLHALKTGALLRASVRLGATAASVDIDTMARLDTYADALGLAFQIRDDLLDVEGDSATLGKTAGKDAAQDKATFPAVLGIDASRRRLDELRETMQDALAPLGDRARDLTALGLLAIQRSR